jgi:hypothetical protein
MIKLETIPYIQYEKEVPQTGEHILAQQSENTIIVYQAFNPKIANYALEHQKFGGEHYRYSRMSWIKPNFLWMMYRCGWASKPNQKRVLAIEIKKSNFDKILAEATYSSFSAKHYKDHTAWRTALDQTEVRLQWDPDHHPDGSKLNRRAIQLGMKGKILEQFGQEWIISIQDVTAFAVAQQPFIHPTTAALEVMKETIYLPNL